LQLDEYTTPKGFKTHGTSQCFIETLPDVLSFQQKVFDSRLVF
jgi:hypothetical protein